jgi:prepilin-type processing-associated H-X9-DG protein
MRAPDVRIQRRESKIDPATALPRRLFVARNWLPLSQGEGASFCERRGLTLTEVLFLLALIVVVVLFLLMIIPRVREQARLTGCEKNLAQIGVALAIYDQTQYHLPGIIRLSAVDDSGESRSPGPLRTLVETLQIPDFRELKDVNSPFQRRPGEVPGEIRVPGFFCTSDPNATTNEFSAPVSYRAVTGGSSAGDDGAFAIGRRVELRDIEAADGTSYTAGFSERLVGDHQSDHRALGNYQVVPGPLSGEACPAENVASTWRGDAGASWRFADYRYTLYNHASPPGADRSCLALDGKTAFMGASSGHVRGVNLLFLDGHVSIVTREIDSRVWRDFASISKRQPAPPPPAIRIASDEP